MDPRTRSAAFGVALGAWALVAASCATPAADTSERAGDPLLAAEVYAAGSGVSFGGSFKLPESRDLINYRLQVPPGSVDHAIFWPNNWDYGMDGDPPAHPHLRAGEPMHIMAWTVPACDGTDVDAPDPALLVRSTAPDGQVVEDRFTLPADLVSDAYSDFCDLGVSAFHASMRGSADPGLSEVSVTYEITNPGPDDVTVTSRPWSLGDGRWLAASVAVPAGETRTLRVTGLEVCDGPGADGPIFMGLLVSTVKGETPRPVTTTEKVEDGSGVCNNLH